MKARLTSRAKRPLNREIPHLRDTRLVIIATEDTYAVKQYFESEIFSNPRVQVIILETQQKENIDGIPATASAPRYVFERLREFIKSHDLDTEDVICLMVDRDRWTDKMLQDVCRHTFKLRNGRDRIELAVSNPCFELWLYLHHQEWNSGNVTSKVMEKNLRILLGCYNKSNIDIDKFIGKEGNAVKRAEAMDLNPKMRWPQTTGTHVYKIVKRIKSIAIGKNNRINQSAAD